MKLAWIGVPAFVCCTFACAMLSAEEDNGRLTIEDIAKLPKEIESCKLEYQKRGESRYLTVYGVKYSVRLARSATGFDGTRYWADDLRSPAPRYETASFLRMKQLDTHPLIAPYQWAWEMPGKATWSELRDDSIWESLKDKVSFEATMTIRDQVCDVFLIEHPENQKQYRVAFSRKLAGFPIRIESIINGELLATANILETHRSGPSAIIATKGEVELKGRGVMAWFEVDADSIIVNQPLEESEFQPSQKR